MIYGHRGRGIGMCSQMGSDAGSDTTDFPWDPSTEPELGFWVDAQDAGTITETEGEVSEWADKKNSSDMTPGLAGSPTQETVGGFNMLRFGPLGSDANLVATESPAGSYDFSGDFTLALVLQDIATEATHVGYPLYIGSDGETENRSNISINYAIGQLGLSLHDGETWGGGITANTETFPISNNKRWLVILERSGTTLSFYLANEDMEVTQAGSTTWSHSLGEGMLAFGCPNYAESSKDYDGYIGEICIWNKALGDGKREWLWNYMKTKWNMVASG